MKNEKATLIPAIDTSAESNAPYGWINIDGPLGNSLWDILDWHSFDDKGTSLETLTIRHRADARYMGTPQGTRRLKEIYSHDEGETFTFELQEA